MAAGPPCRAMMLAASSSASFASAEGRCRSPIAPPMRRLDGLVERLNSRLRRSGLGLAIEAQRVEQLRQQPAAPHDVLGRRLAVLDLGCQRASVSERRGL